MVMDPTEPPDGSVRIAFTLLEAAGKKLLTKKIWASAGRLEKEAAASPARGTFRHVELEGIADEVMEAFAAILHGLTRHQAIIASRLPQPAAADGKPWGLRLAADVEDAHPLPRSQDPFRPVAGSAIGFLDIDVPEPLRATLRSAEAVR